MNKNKTIMFKDHLPKNKVVVEKHRLPEVEKAKIEDFSTKKIGQEGIDFMKLGEANNVDFNAFFVMFTVWMNVPSGDKEAVILQLVKEGKVDLGEDVRKDSEGK